MNDGTEIKKGSSHFLLHQEDGAIHFKEPANCHPQVRVNTKITRAIEQGLKKVGVSYAAN